MIFKKHPDQEVEESVFQDLENHGIAAIEDCISEEYLERSRQFVTEQLAIQGNKYFSLIAPQKIANSPFRAISEHADFLQLLRGLTTRAAGAAAADFSLYSVLRVLTNYSGVEQSYKFHYDATVVTVLMPVFIPDGQAHESGDLIVFPNQRPLRRFALFNILEKLLLQNKWIWNRIARNLAAGTSKAQSIKLKPGNLYVFWGYRTYHANFPCNPEKLRATALFHFGNPHPKSWLLRLPLLLRRWSDQRNRAKALPSP